MKLKSASIFILFSVIFIGRAQAQYVKYDSLGVDSLIAITQDIDQPNNIKGLVQDGYQVHLQG
ncbi:MAG TPA: hypothetical protein VG537_02495, partial [Candidatus Kapabacteria bacterium]|nr:hypothetical protein [Candidatus Kapabacteria bacterium]